MPLRSRATGIRTRGFRSCALTIGRERAASTAGGSPLLLRPADPAGARRSAARGQRSRGRNTDRGATARTEGGRAEIFGNRRRPNMSFATGTRTRARWSLSLKSSQSSKRTHRDLRAAEWDRPVGIRDAANYGFVRRTSRRSLVWAPTSPQRVRKVWASAVEARRRRLREYLPRRAGREGGPRFAARSRRGCC